MIIVLFEALDVTKFETQSCYSDQFWTNVFEKGMDPFIPAAVG